MNYYYYDQQELDAVGLVGIKPTMWNDHWNDMKITLAGLLIIYSIYISLRYATRFFFDVLQHWLYYRTLVILTVVSVAILIPTIYHSPENDNNFADYFVTCYRHLIDSTVLQTFGFRLSEMKLSTSREFFTIGTILLIATFFSLLYIVRFLAHHHVFGFILFLVATCLYLVPFPISDYTVKSYRGSFFVIDRVNNAAYVSPSLIPKILLMLIITYRTSIYLFRTFSFLFKMSIRLLMLSMIALFIVSTCMQLFGESSTINQANQSIVN